jgi:hypothetical protein
MMRVSALILFLILIPFNNFAAEKGDFSHLAPTYDSEKSHVSHKGEIFGLDKCGLIDKDNDGVNETEVCRYKHPSDSNKLILRYNTYGNFWAWAIFDNFNDENDEVNNFAIVDTAGGGKFDTKIGQKELFTFPEWVKVKRGQ